MAARAARDWPDRQAAGRLQGRRQRGCRDRGAVTEAGPAWWRGCTRALVAGPGQSRRSRGGSRAPGGGRAGTAVRPLGGRDSGQPQRDVC